MSPKRNDRSMIAMAVAIRYRVDSCSGKLSCVNNLLESPAKWNCMSSAAILRNVSKRPRFPWMFLVNLLTECGAG